MSEQRAHEDFGGEVPEGWQWVDGHPFPPHLEVVSQVSPPRHDWNDVLSCPQCGKAWLTKQVAVAATKQQSGATQS